MAEVWITVYKASVRARLPLNMVVGRWGAEAGIAIAPRVGPRRASARDFKLDAFSEGSFPAPRRSSTRVPTLPGVHFCSQNMTRP